MRIFREKTARPKLCFFHLPRTGGTALTKDILFPNFPRWRWCHVNYGAQLQPLDGAHDPLRWGKVRRLGIELLAGHMPFGFASQFPGSFDHFTFLRDPIARTVSDYYFVLQNHSNAASQAARRLSLTEFVEANYASSNNCYARWLSNAAFGAVFSSETEMLNAALRNLSRCSFVGITEQFTTAVQHFCRKYGLTPYGMREANRNNATPAEFSLTKQERDAIQRQNALDLAIYSQVIRKFSLETQGDAAILPK